MKDNLDYAKIIKSKLNLLDFVGKDLRLIKSGNSYKALCPFHNEKTPSFTINQEKNTFNCFGCGKSGDIFTFVMEKYKVDFKESLHILANEIGIDINKSDFQSIKKNTENKNKYFQIMNLITKYYHEKLKKNYGYNHYISSFLKSKNIDIKTIEKFYLGYSESFDSVIAFLLENKIEPQTLLNLGIFKKNSKGKIYDIFAKRIIFPIKDKLNSTPEAYSII